MLSRLPKSECMTIDPVLEALIAAAAFVIAADRYEEETGDTELAALMRIPGLEWELVDGVPGLKVVAAFVDGERWAWWTLTSGVHAFGTVYLQHEVTPEPVENTPVLQLLRETGFSQSLAPRLYQLYREAVERECVL